MRLLRWTVVVFVAALGGCGWFSSGRSFAVYFEPYSSEINQQARDTIGQAATFAKAHPSLPITVAGFSAPPDPGSDVEGLSGHRAAAVKQIMVEDGVASIRITTAANGITDPKTLPTVAVRRVDISVGQ